MRIICILFVLVLSTFILSAQNSFIHNHNFENTSPNDIGWMTQTNKSTEIIVNDDLPFFANHHLLAHGGDHFAYVGGYQDASGLYQGELAQEFYLPVSGTAKLSFYVRYIRESADPGSYIRIMLDGNEVWSIAPHFLVDSPEDYFQETVELGHLTEGNHTISIQGYEYPLGGDLPMQFAFDDFMMQVNGNASIEETNNAQFNVSIGSGTVQLLTYSFINAEALINVTDMSGKVLISTNTYFQNSFTFSTTGITPGIYVVSLHTNLIQLSRKIYIQP